MALPSNLGSGGTGFHGEDAAVTRAHLEGLSTGGVELQTNFNDLLAKLDLDASVTDVNYESTLESTSDLAGVMNAAFGHGGAFVHGEGGIKTKHILAGLAGGGDELKTQQNLLRAKLDLDAGVAGTDYAGISSTDEQQTLTLTNDTGGTFTVSFGGDTTVALSNAATAATVQTELEALSSIGAGNVSVAGAAGGPYTVTFVGDLAGTNVAAMTASAALLTGTDEVQTLTISNDTGGTYTITFDGQTTAAVSNNATAAQVQTALEALSNVGVGDVAVTGATGGPYTLTFQGALGDENVAEITTNVALLLGTNEVQQIVVTADGGTWDLTYSGQTAAGLAWNVSAANLQTALVALSNIAPGDVAVTGGPGDATGSAPYVVTFQGALGSQNVTQMTTSVAALEMLAVPGDGTAVVSTTTPGVAPTAVPATTTPGATPTAIVATTVPGVPTSSTTDVNAGTVLAELGSGAGAAHGDQARALSRQLANVGGLSGELTADFNALLAKLDADGGVTDTDYASTLGI